MVTSSLNTYIFIYLLTSKAVMDYLSIQGQTSTKVVAGALAVAVQMVWGLAARPKRLGPRLARAQRKPGRRRRMWTRC